MKSHRKEGFRRWIQNEDYERKICSLWVISDSLIKA